MKQRDIKFRMWTGAKMLYDVSNVYECLKQQKGFDAGYVIGRSNPIGVIPYDHVTDGSLFLQYTGLKDKNGKEIYEGDILETSRRKGRGYIKNYNEAVRFSAITARWYPLDIVVTERCAVIGNIYENPELLKP